MEITKKSFDDKLYEYLSSFDKLNEIATSIFNTLASHCSNQKTADLDLIEKTVEAQNLTEDELKSKWKEIYQILSREGEDIRRKKIFECITAIGFMELLNREENQQEIYKLFMAADSITINFNINLYKWVGIIISNSKRLRGVWKKIIDSIGLCYKSFYKEKENLWLVIIGLRVQTIIYLDPKIKERVLKEIELTFPKEIYYHLLNLINSSSEIKSKLPVISGEFSYRISSRIVTILLWITGLRILKFLLSNILKFFFGYKKKASITLFHNRFELNIEWELWGKKIKEKKIILFFDSVMETGVIGKYNYFYMVVGFLSGFLGLFIGSILFTIGLKIWYLKFIIYGLQIILLSIIMDVVSLLWEIKKGRGGIYYIRGKWKEYYIKGVEENKLKNFLNQLGGLV